MIIFRDTAEINLTYLQILFMYQDHIISLEGMKFITLVQNPVEFFTIEYMGKFHVN